jgi:hypothetical protein
MLHYLLENKLNSQFPDSHIFNHRIIDASFGEKGSHTGQAISNDGFFFVYQWVRMVAFFLALPNSCMK